MLKEMGLVLPPPKKAALEKEPESESETAGDTKGIIVPIKLQSSLTDEDFDQYNDP